MAANRTFYDVLGVSPHAKVTEIGLAYKRIRAEMQREDAPPDPKRAAMAKVAYETLSDPDRRAEYDASLSTAAPPAARRRRARSAPWAAIGGAAFVLVAAAAAYWLLRGPGPAADKAAAPTPQQLLESTAELMGRVKGTVMSGEVREAGMALATGPGEMVTTCHALPAGAQLSVALPGGEAKAEIARASEELGICTLAVRGAGPDSAKLRASAPSVGEKVLAVAMEGARPVSRPGRVARVANEGPGPVIELEIAGPALPTGTPVIDLQGRVVGLVTTQTPAAGGIVLALGAARIDRSAAVAGAATPAPSPAASAAVPSAAGAAAVPVPRTRRNHGEKVEEGFMTQWVEDEEGRMIQPVDAITRGVMGEPVLYWTRWVGRDEGRRHVFRCVITFHEIEDAIVDFTKQIDNTTRDGYWYCGFDSGQGRYFEGTYRFILFLEGDQVSEGTIRIEKRFLDRLHLSPLKLALGALAGVVLLVGWLRKKRAGE